MPSFGRVVVVLGGAALFLAACASGDDTTAASLTDSPWRATQYADAAGTMVQPREGSILSAHFDGERVTGSAGCNNYTGGYAAGDGTIEIGPLAATLKLCDGGMEEEVDYLSAMQSADAYVITDGMLRLENGGTVVAEYEAAPVGLPGTAWNVTSMNNGKEGMQSLVVGTEITVGFSEGGTVSGSTGCNEYSGSYEVTDDAIEMGPFAVTERACAEAEAMDQEAVFVGYLQSAVTFTITDQLLTLFDAEGSKLLDARQT